MRRRSKKRLEDASKDDRDNDGEAAADEGAGVKKKKPVPIAEWIAAAAVAAGVHGATAGGDAAAGAGEFVSAPRSPHVQQQQQQQQEQQQQEQQQPSTVEAGVVDAGDAVGSDNDWLLPIFNPEPAAALPSDKNASLASASAADHAPDDSVPASVVAPCPPADPAAERAPDPQRLSDSSVVTLACSAPDPEVFRTVNEVCDATDLESLLDAVMTVAEVRGGPLTEIAGRGREFALIRNP